MATLPMVAQATGDPAPLIKVDTNLIYAMVVLAMVQAILILSLAGILRTMGGPGGWIARFMNKGGRPMSVLALFLLTATSANAQAFKGDGNTLSNYQLFWILVAVNVFLFILILVQLDLVRRLTRLSTEPGDARRAVAVESGPTWIDRLWHKLSNRVPAEQEEDILMHHEYDGIRELDNVLPPWWLWLFYGTIAWSVMYLVNVHVIDLWPDPGTEYSMEMEQAAVDIAAYQATLTSIVDENTVQLTANEDVLTKGRELFTQFCTPCHGKDAAGSESSVGPNLTDAFWLHGGGVRNIFKTIKYGVPEKGMISWKAQLQPAEISALANYIISLEGTGPATQKAPQGDRWSEEAAPADSSTAPVDTTGTLERAVAQAAS